MDHLRNLLPEGVDVAITDLADTVFSLNRWPYCDLAHFILIALAIRDDTAAPGHRHTNTGCHVFSRRHPIATYLSVLLSGVAGALIVNVVCGLPVAQPLANNRAVLMATVVWYLIFYSPGDVVYRMCKFFPVLLFIQLVKEVHRAMLIEGGVVRALGTYPNGYVIAVLCGVITGAGSGVFRMMDRLIRGIWIPDTHEALNPGFFTRASGIVAIVFVVKKCSSLIPGAISYPLVYLGAVAAFIYFRLLAALFNISDPMRPIEGFASRLLFGDDSPSVNAAETGDARGKDKENSAPSNKKTN